MPCPRLLASCFSGLLLVACSPAGDGGPTTAGATTTTGGETTGTGTTGGTTTGSTTQPNPTTGDSTTTSDGTTTTDGGGFIVSSGSTDPGPGDFECDPWTQDCPEGQKCTAWANDGTEHWNATHCVPVVDNPALPGDPCQLEDGPASGVDNCDKGSFCWYINYQTLEGVCLPACTGSPDAWSCPDNRHCDISNNGTLLLCLETCDPLVPSCPTNQICFGSIDGTEFICDSGNVGALGMYGDPCSFINSCAYGLFCADPSVVPDCQSGNGCCSEYCDLTQPNTCSGMDGGQECVAWFPMGEEPPGHEDVGYCTIPQ